jgi:hypothetical protein
MSVVIEQKKSAGWSPSHMPPSAGAEDWILRVALSIGEEATALHAELGSKLLQLSAELQTQVLR